MAVLVVHDITHDFGVVVVLGGQVLLVQGLAHQQFQKLMLLST